jgi:hypothetical protein
VLESSCYFVVVETVEKLVSYNHPRMPKYRLFKVCFETSCDLLKIGVTGTVHSKLSLRCMELAAESTEDYVHNACAGKASGFNLSNLGR